MSRNFANVARAAVSYDARGNLSVDEEGQREIEERDAAAQTDVLLRAQYDIHHIHPREFGGTNDFWNLVPVERASTHKLFNTLWREFDGL